MDIVVVIEACKVISTSNASASRIYKLGNDCTEKPEKEQKKFIEIFLSIEFIKNPFKYTSMKFGKPQGYLKKLLFRHFA